MSSTTLEGAVQSPVKGVLQKPGVVWTPETRAFMAVLRARVPKAIPLVVTSGYRSVTAQAKALQAKRTLGDDLTKLYVRGNGPAIVAALLAVPNSVDAMAKVLQGFVARGIYMSQHMRSTAVDLRYRGLTSVQIERIRQEAAGLGANVNVETKPPHIHIGARDVKLPASSTRSGGGGKLLLAGLALGLWAATRK